MSDPVVDGNNDALTGHIISTTIGGKNGEPKQVLDNILWECLVIQLEYFCSVKKCFSILS